MPGVFVTATGTEVGKTYVTSGLLRAGRRAGAAMDALKPILTGYRGADAASSDAGCLLQALGAPVTMAAVARIAPWRFVAPLSPNMAAAQEKRRIDYPAVVGACHAAVRPDRLTLIEGIGGVMVPLDERYTILDLIAALALPVVLVSGTQLGALSHCLTAEAVLRAKGCAPALVILNESAASTVPLVATQATLSTLCSQSRIVTIPRDAGEQRFDALFQMVLGFAA